MITWSGYFHAEWVLTNPLLSAYGHGNIAEGTQNYGIHFFYYWNINLVRFRKVIKTFYRTLTIKGLCLVIFNIFLLALVSLLHMKFCSIKLHFKILFHICCFSMLIISGINKWNPISSPLLPLMLSLKTKTNPYLYEQFKCLLYYSINLLLCVEAI